MNDTKPINIPNKVDRSLSDQFDRLSNSGKQIILGMTDGIRPSTKPDFSKLQAINRVRFDSADFSPVTLSLLKFHGIKDAIPKVKKN
jgi:hypothetical protein